MVVEKERESDRVSGFTHTHTPASCCSRVPFHVVTNASSNNNSYFAPLPLSVSFYPVCRSFLFCPGAALLLSSLSLSLPLIPSGKAGK